MIVPNMGGAWEKRYAAYGVKQNAQPQLWEKAGRPMLLITTLPRT